MARLRGACGTGGRFLGGRGRNYRVRLSCFVCPLCRSCTAAFPRCVARAVRSRRPRLADSLSTCGLWRVRNGWLPGRFARTGGIPCAAARRHRGAPAEPIQLRSGRLLDVESPSGGRAGLRLRGRPRRHVGGRRRSRGKARSKRAVLVRELAGGAGPPKWRHTNGSKSHLLQRGRNGHFGARVYVIRAERRVATPRSRRALADRRAPRDRHHHRGALREKSGPRSSRPAASRERLVVGSRAQRTR